MKLQKARAGTERSAAANGSKKLAAENQRLKRLLEDARVTIERVHQRSQEIAGSYSRLAAEIQANQEQLFRLSRGVLQVQEEERARISRELHDGIGQALTALLIHIDVLHAKAGKSSPGIAAQIDELKTQAAGALSDVRELSRMLRPRMLDDLGLLPTLRWYIKNFAARTGIKVSLKTRRLPGMEPILETALFRATQEALTNVSKHARASRVLVKLSSNSEKVALEIRDDGAGFFPATLERVSATATGSGLPGLRERFLLLHGELVIDSRPGKGTRITVKAPLRQQWGKHG